MSPFVSRCQQQSRYHAAKRPEPTLGDHVRADDVPAHDHEDVEALRHENCPGCKAAAKGKPHRFVR